MQWRRSLMQHFRRCGPCKMFKPTFAQFAEAYTEQTVFLSVMGDANASTAKLMKRLAVKAVPAFFFFKEGQQARAARLAVRA